MTGVAHGLRFACLLASSLTVAVAQAEEPPPASPSAAIARADGKRSKGDLKGAIASLKAAVNTFPDNERLRHALSVAYLDDGNDFWALKVLTEYEQEHPPACDTRALQAWIHIRKANFDLAEEILDTPGCDMPPHVHARHLLLRARIADQQGEDAKAERLVEEARSQDRFYEEDKTALDALSQRYDPGRMPVTSWRVDLATGWTSNGLAGSPVDPADVDVDTSSYLTQLDARFRVVVPASRSIRPVLETQLRLMELGAQTVSALSYRQPSLRPGVLLGDTFPRLLLTYSFDAVQLAGGDRYEDGPLWYSEGHRFDYELEATDNLFAFGGGGHRSYRESGRTRWEAEQGLAAGFSITDDFRLMSGVSARWHRAENEAYDANGMTVLLQALYRLPAELEARLNLSYSYDDYPRSTGYFQGSMGAARTDSQVRIKPGLWSPSFSGVRFGVDWEYSHRSSTAENYAFDDNRVLVHGVWVMDGDRFGADLIPPEGREPMPHAVSAEGQLSSEEMRIRDLMRQDEAVKRGSSCLN